MSQFRLQNRAGMGIVATKFRKAGDRMAALRIVNSGDELMMITTRGIIIRQSVDAISCQSRAASGVRLQRLDDDDEIAAATPIPVSTAEDAIADASESDSPEANLEVEVSPEATNSAVPDDSLPETISLTTVQPATATDVTEPAAPIAEELSEPDAIVEPTVESTPPASTDEE